MQVVNSTGDSQACHEFESSYPVKS